MTERTLSSPRRIDPAALDPDNYAQSLMNGAYLCGIMDSDRIAAMQTEFLALTETLCRKITGGKDTVHGGIAGFFRLYDPETGAHEHHITADYPLYGGMPQAEGIDFIAAYLDGIAAESAFCRCFAKETLIRLMNRAAPGWENIPCSLFCYPFASALALLLSGRSPDNLDLTARELAALAKRLENAGEEGTRELLSRALADFCRDYALPARTAAYLEARVPTLTAEALAAIRRGMPGSIFVTPAHP